jgi:Domain of unknown function (DUF6475)
MTLEKFIIAMVAYYSIDSAKDEFKISAIKEFIKPLTDEERKELFNKAITNFEPTSTNTFPLVVHLNKLLNPPANVEVEAAKAYALLEKKSYRYASIAIEDPRISHALQAIGGWINFCDRTTEEAPFMRKGFIAAFKSANEMNLPKEPRKFRGELETADNNMIYIGNEENIKLLLTSDATKSILPNMTKLIVKE